MEKKTRRKQSSFDLVTNSSFCFSNGDAVTAAEKRRRQESYGLDAINGSGSVATLETRRALQCSLRGEFIDHK
ncbi:BnaC03g64550D [Brassica napus]|uniref:BnaC03g64550D protein n=2 Tax=Brassica TaxID=3705 RepID=A0A078GLE1_BRANA|nr:BnaC03g64550D [Brassica napus]VDC99660.1 unnamed protein product [Brassica oleracea]